MTEEVLTELDSTEDRPKNEKNKKSAFTRVKERLSIRSKNKNKKGPENIQENGENKKDPIDKEAVNGTGKNIQPEVSEEKKEEAEKKPKSGGTLERVKMRLSTRKKDGKSGETATKQETLDPNVSVEKETVSADDAKKETEDKTKEEKSKSFLQRILRFFRSKKNKGNAENQEDEKSGDLADSEEKNEAISSDEDDNEILAICGKEEEEEKTPVIPIITTSKPPLPGEIITIIIIIIIIIITITITIIISSQAADVCPARPPPPTPGPCPSWTRPSSSSSSPPPPAERTSGTPDRTSVRWRSRWEGTTLVTCPSSEYF